MVFVGVSTITTLWGRPPGSPLHVYLTWVLTVSPLDTERPVAQLLRCGVLRRAEPYNRREPDQLLLGSRDDQAGQNGWNRAHNTRPSHMYGYARYICRQVHSTRHREIILPAAYADVVP